MAITLIKTTYIKLFMDLEDAGVGTIVQIDSSTKKFVWRYSLRDVSEQILNPNKQMEIKPVEADLSSKGKRGRPVGYRVGKAKRSVREKRS
jgi:hypothetical protein